ncbi:hypothetical protein Tco_0845732 [Tanacetum coccineum]
MHTRSSGEDSISPLSKPERFIHQTIKKTKKRHPFIPLENRQPRIKYPPFLNLLEAEVVYNPFHDLPFPLTDDQPMLGNNRAIAPTPGAPIVTVDLRDNFTMKVSDQNATRPIGYLPSNTQTNPKPSSAPNDEAYRPPPARTEHVNVVCTHSGKTYDPPSNPHDKITVIHDDSDDKAKDKAEEDNPTPSTLKRTEPIPMKAYKPRILYP